MPKNVRICEEQALATGVPFKAMLTSYLEKGYTEVTRYQHEAVGTVVILSTPKVEEYYQLIEEWFGKNHPLQTQMLAMLLSIK